MATFPFEPPRPELAIETNGMPVLERDAKEIASVATRKRQRSREMFVFGLKNAGWEE